MKYNKLIILFLSLAIFSVAGYSQQGTVIGKVIDTEKQTGLPGTEITNASGRVVGITTSDGTFSLSLPEGEHILYINNTDFDQAVIEVVVKTDEVTDAGTTGLRSSALSRQDLFTLNISEGIEDDGFETQSVQGILSAGADVFLSNAAYTFGPVMFRVRGYDANYSNVSLNGFVMNDIESGSPYWSNWGGLNDVMRSAMVTSGPEPIGFLFEPVGGATRINTRASEYRTGIKAVYSLSNRTYGNRLMLTYSTGLMDNNWAITGSYSKRWSERGYEEGTFYDANSFFLSVEKKLNPRHSLNFTALNAIYERGVAGGTTQEIYDLMNDNFYNPYWGYQNGEVRNSRVRSNNKPLLTLAHIWNPGEKVDVQTTVGYWFGKSGYSALNWYDPLDPRPDYYRKLPSYYTDQEDSLRIATAWVNDPSVSHIDWDGFYFANRKNLFYMEDAEGIPGNNVTGLRSKYIVEDRRNDISQFQLNTRASWDLNERLNVTGGILADIFRGHNFNTVKDLLGGEFWLDIDKFAESDQPANRDALQNDLENPDNLAVEGDIIGNNYYVFQRGGTLWGTGRYSHNRYSVYLSGNVRYTSMWREGLMRKGLFPDNSLGKSEVLDYMTWGVKAGGDYRITGRHLITLNTLIATNPPLFRNSFLSPRTRNTATPNLQEETIISADASYVLRAPWITGRITGYYTKFMKQTEVTTFYHDDLMTLVNYAMTNIDKENYGLEIGAEVTLTTGLTLNTAAALGQYLWVNNPNITITQDNNNEVLRIEEVWIKYFRQSGTPQTAFSLGLEYNSSRYWWASITGSYYDNIYLDFNPVTRTKDAETGYFQYWDIQKKQAPGYLLDIFLGKSWRIKDTFISLSANISNILNNKSFGTGGFEQYRYDPDRPDLFDPKVYYYNGFNYFLNFSVRM
ncbi:MAG TPA: TonB-dependent receptor [Bacteroidales bacterium]|nr:TonB-dependent receptor [Bacteroidales bacterium]HPJ59137.1 TonB-dependent receptor [Bacteroidales bacterium]HPR12749.1 TonB-dependent receptor [Bacteroidales bacterium]HRW84353.1 TonB-dependent receptor [Bacteroidales bacterium]